jgi:hypothetical protein
VAVPQKLLAFAVGLVLAFAAGYGIGGVVEPVIDDEPPAAPASPEHEEEHDP